MTVDVPALKTFDYRGQTYVRGEIVPMRPIEAAVYARRGCVSLSKQPTPLVRAQVPAPEPVRPRRRRYRRRDMTAETA